MHGPHGDYQRTAKVRSAPARGSAGTRVGKQIGSAAAAVRNAPADLAHAASEQLRRTAMATGDALRSLHDAPGVIGHNVAEAIIPALGRLAGLPITPRLGESAEHAAERAGVNRFGEHVSEAVGNLTSHVLMGVHAAESAADTYRQVRDAPRVLADNIRQTNVGHALSAVGDAWSAARDTFNRRSR